MELEVSQFLQKEIEQQHIPGFVLQVRHKDEVVFEDAFGYRSIFPQKAQMEINTVFDLASLTKVVATLPVFLKFIDDGVVRLEDKVTKFIPNFDEHGKENITLRHLLTHSSGLQAHAPFAAEDIRERESIITALVNEKLAYKPGEDVIYSDVGFALLSIIAEEITGQSFDMLTNELIFQKLGMDETGYNPTFAKNRYAVTEFDGQLNEYKCGIVHDENTYTIGGISGHAGLFSTIKDLGNFAKMVMNEGTFNGKQILSPHAIKLSKRNFTPFSSYYRGVGWELNGEYAASCGDYFSTETFGHTGFTGTSMWFDPEVNLAVILLTNRVHFGRQPHMLSLRPRLHNIIRKYF